MKKDTRYIFLPVLIVLSFFIGNSFSIQKNINKASNTSPANASLNQQVNYPGAEIEYYNNHVSNGLYAQQGLQKIPAHGSYHEKAIVIAQATFFSNSFAAIELFDNNYLYHNYSSHNFW